MRAGQLRHRVTIQQKGMVARDTHGGEVITWQDVGTYWAFVQPVRGREFFEGEGEQSQVDTRIRMRNVGVLDTTMRVVYAGSNYDITQVFEVDERNREILILCRKVTQNEGV